MTLKTKMSLLVFLTSLSIVSIGFSSWSITAETTAEINGNIEVDNVINSDDYIRLDTTKGDIVDEENDIHSGYDTLDYNDYGYLNENNENVSDGELTAYFVVDKMNCYNFFTNYDSLQLDLTLKYANNNPTTLDIFKNITSKQSLSYIISDNGVTHDDITVKSRELTVRMTINNVLSNYNPQVDDRYYYFSIKYIFFAEISNSYFKNNIYPYLYGDNIQFAINVAICGT